MFHPHIASQRRITPMSQSLWRSLPRSIHCEHHWQRCAHRKPLLAAHDDIHPLLSSTHAHTPQILRHRSRPFSTCRQQQAGGMRATVPKVKQRAQPSIAVSREKERAQMMSRGHIPDDVGLIDGTFIMPFKSRPSWFKNFRERIRLERHRLRVRLGELFQLLNYRYWTVRPTPRLHLRQVTAIGKKMHREMYTAFAAGDLKPVQSEICSGLLSSLRSRIGQRPANTHLKWTLHKYLSPPRLVSYKAGVLPNADGRPNKDKEAQNGLTQAIVRIHSLQSLQHVRTTSSRERGKLITSETLVDSEGRNSMPGGDLEVLARENAKETVEYFVIQKQLKRSKEGAWMVWGTAEESSLEKVERGLKKRKQEKEQRKMEAAGA